MTVLAGIPARVLGGIYPATDPVKEGEARSESMMPEQVSEAQRRLAPLLISSSRSRRLRENLQYHRTQAPMIQAQTGAY